MKLRIERFKHNADETIGRLYINGALKGFTLEDEKRTIKIKGETRIPEGTYEIKFRTVGGFHERQLKRYGSDFHKGMLHLQNVPGFDFILIHCGNTDEDTAGCILVGKDYTPHDGINCRLVDSRFTYERIYPEIRDALIRGDKVTIEILAL